MYKLRQVLIVSVLGMAFFMPNADCSLASFIDASIFGSLPPYHFEDSVKNPYDDVPVVLENLFKELASDAGCVEGLFETPTDDVVVERMYRKYVKTSIWPTFTSIKQKAFMLMIMLRQLPVVLIDKETMQEMDRAFAVEWNNERVHVGVFTAIFRVIFNRPRIGRAILRDVLVLMARYAERGCTVEGFFGVSKNVSVHITEPYLQCGFWYECSKFAQAANLNNLVKLGSAVILRIFSPIDPSITQKIIEKVNDLSPSYHWSKDLVSGQQVQRLPETSVSRPQSSIDSILNVVNSGSEASTTPVAPPTAQPPAPGPTGRRSDGGAKLVIRQPGLNYVRSPYGYMRGVRELSPLYQKRYMSRDYDFVNPE